MANKRKEFLATTKASIYQKYMGRCNNCGDGGTYKGGWHKATTRKTFYLGGLEIHHIIPVYLGGDNSIKNLILLCKECHREQHRLLNR